MDAETKVPERIWLERWPEEADRDDTIFYEQAGYGDNLRGHTSTVYVYVREDALDSVAREVAEADQRLREHIQNEPTMSNQKGCWWVWADKRDQLRLAVKAARGWFDRVKGGESG